MKLLERIASVLCLLAAGVCLAAPLLGGGALSKWLNASGLLLTLAGLFQLEISQLVSRWLEGYSDVDKYPFGPPSHAARHLIDNPDAPVRTFARNVYFFRVKTGFWLIVAGTLLQLIAVCV